MICLGLFTHKQTHTRTLAGGGRAGVRHVFVYELGSFVWPSHAGEGLNFRFVSISTACVSFFFSFWVVSLFWGVETRFVYFGFVCLYSPCFFALLFFRSLSFFCLSTSGYAGSEDTERNTRAACQAASFNCCEWNIELQEGLPRRKRRGERERVCPSRSIDLAMTVLEIICGTYFTLSSFCNFHT